MILKPYILLLIYIVCAPILGGLLAGIDRIISARLQGRVGQPLFQPFYDVFKLWGKENLVVTRFQKFYVYCFLVFVVFTGALFFTGGDFLMVIFALTLAAIFFVLAGYAVNSPYSHVGAERELLQMMSYEPMVILMAVSMYMVTGTFNVSEIAATNLPIIQYLPGIFIGFVYILTIKLRKSPFDLSASHHAHQELVRGITTDFSGRTLALIEIAHWYENILILGFVYLFFANNPALGVGVALGLYLLEILLDNSEARVKWQAMLKTSWWVAVLAGVVNVIVLAFLKQTL